MPDHLAIYIYQVAKIFSLISFKSAIGLEQTELNGLLNSLSFVLPLIIASMLDWLIGDPWDWLHPVQVMGWVVAWAKSLMLKYLANELAQRIAGVLLAIGLIMGSYGIAWALIFAASRVNPWFGLVAESIMIASCLAHRSLQDAAVSVLEPIEKDDLDLARKKLALYVGRDTEQLDRPEILRAVLETVAENCTDGVIAPLIFAIVGGAPLALAYKAASTLDSMIGYKEKPYTYIGWFSAKLEDALTWLPCRLLVLAIALLSGRPVQIWRLCQRDAPQDPSPNAGWSECAFAAALGVQLGGKNTYRGLVKTKPLLGEPDRQITIAVINETLGLMQQCFVLFLGLGVLSHTLVSFSGLLLGLIQHG